MRRFTIGALVSAIGILAALSIPARAQAPAKAASSTAPAKPYTTPKTPWGDPDISGTWSSDDLRNIPVQRPAELGSRSQLSDDEYAKRLADADQARTRELNRVGAFRNDVGTRTFRQTSLVVEPADGRLPITADAQKEVDRRQQQRSNPPNSWTDRSLYDRCITRGFPSSGMPTIYGNSSQIIQGPGYVAIVYEMIHDTRIIPLDGRPHLGTSSQFDFGDSRGRWEGETLVVETTNFRDRSVYMNATPDRLTITERLTRVSPRQVRWSVTMDDPTTWTAPWTFSLPLTLDDSEPLQLYECHEGNYGLKNILSAARAEERHAAEGSK